MATSTSTSTRNLVIQSMTGMVHFERIWKGRRIAACSSGRTQVVLFPITAEDAQAYPFCKRCAAKA